jgi:hypothetical protein
MPMWILVIFLEIMMNGGNSGIIEIIAADDGFDEFVAGVVHDGNAEEGFGSAGDLV